ncbi:MAG: hypothetical protein MR624_00685 [Bacteroidales bacterium]|nr:hypothetical protein [Bacteroidales bacterium]
MKRYLLSIALGLAALTAGAQQTDYLTLRMADGTECSVPSSGLTLTFGNGQMTVRSAQGTTNYTLTSLAQMWFAATPTAISSLSGSNAGIRIVGGQVVATGIAPADIRVFTPDGREVGQSGLTRGLYIVRTPQQTYKVTAP